MQINENNETGHYACSASNAELDELWQQINVMAQHDPGIYALIHMARRDKFSRERLALEIAVHQSKLVAEMTAQLIDAARRARICHLI